MVATPAVVGGRALISVTRSGHQQFDNQVCRGDIHASGGTLLLDIGEYPKSQYSYSLGRPTPTHN